MLPERKHINNSFYFILWNAAMVTDITWMLLPRTVCVRSVLSTLIENKKLPAVVDTIPSYWWSFTPQNWSSYGADVSLFPNDSEWNIDVFINNGNVESIKVSYAKPPFPNFILLKYTFVQFLFCL